MIINLIICATIAFCVYTIANFVDKSNERTVENEYITDKVLSDIETIKDIIERTEKLYICTESVKHNILTIKHIVYKYVEKDTEADTSSNES